MIYFIPSWYKHGSWNDNDQGWYAGKNKSEYDDSVKQIQLFHRRNVIQYQVLILGHMPNLRHFLHRQGIFRANYWSCFDAICEIKKQKMSMFSFRNLKWPEETEFEYTPFAVIANVNGEKYAQIEFGVDGNMVSVDIYEGNRIARRNIYDDRGFVGRSVVFENGIEKFCEYYMENGVWKMRCHLDDGHVEINQRYANYFLVYNGEEYSLPFSKEIYSSLDELIEEVVGEYVALMSEEDIFCFAMHKMHIDIIKNGFRDKKTILSFYEDRLDFSNKEINRDSIRDVIDNSSYIVTDSVATTEYVECSIGARDNIIDISPYDSRRDFGISQQIPMYKIMVPVDDLPDDILEQIIRFTYGYMGTNDKVEVHFFTRCHKEGDREAIDNKISAAFDKANIDKALLELGEEQSRPSPDRVERFFVNQCIDELSVSRFIKEQRVLVDLRERPEQYIQIAAISAGIPQIVRIGNEYIEDGFNGIVLKNIEGLTRALSYYLGSLANWNDAMVNAYQIGKKYSTQVLLDSWKEVIRALE